MKPVMVVLRGSVSLGDISSLEKDGWLVVQAMNVTDVRTIDDGTIWDLFAAAALAHGWSTHEAATTADNMMILKKEHDAKTALDTKGS